MNINSVKIQEENGKVTGYLVNGSHTIQIGSRLEKVVKDWISNGNTPEPMHTAEEKRIQELNKIIQDAKQYLLDTGWYIERLNDPTSGKAIPQDVLDGRVKARGDINTAEAELGGLI